jgi:hypothetical protein
MPRSSPTSVRDCVPRIAPFMALAIPFESGSVKNYADLARLATSAVLVSHKS